MNDALHFRHRSRRSDNSLNFVALIQALARLRTTDVAVTQITPSAMASKPCMRTVKHTGDR
jgi:hypothetical protein